MFERADFKRLAEQLATIRGRFVLSINATPGARETFARFTSIDVETIYTVNDCSGQRVKELIVTG